MLKGKVILITGSSGGIGGEAAKLLAQNQAKVVINYHKNRESAEKITNEIKNSGGESISIKADVTDEKEVSSLVNDAIKTFSKIDVLINNASPAIDNKPFKNTVWPDFEQQLDVGLKGSFNCSKEVLPGMLGRKKGKIISVITTYALGRPPNSLSPYVTAKYALMGLSKALAAELGPQGITVNMVSPGLTETGLVKDIPEKLKEITAIQTPLKRIGTPDDVAKVLLFLSSDYSDYLNGVNIPICGGNVME